MSEITSMVALFVALSSTIMSLLSFLESRKSNRLEKQPMLQIEFDDYDNAPVKISLTNKGKGLLRIEKYTIKADSKNYTSLYDLIQEFKGIKWSEYSADQAGRVLSQDESILLLQFEHDENNNDEKELRKVLGKATIEVVYSDIYDKIMRPTIRSCKWFDR